MQRVVLDMDCLVMAIYCHGAYFNVWQSFLDGDYTLCVSNEIIEEYLEVLARNINRRVAEAIVYAILSRENICKLTPHYHFRLIKADEDNNKFVDCAIAGNAKYIVTEDHHFTILKQVAFPSVAVIGIDAFLKELEDASKN